MKSNKGHDLNRELSDTISRLQAATDERETAASELAELENSYGVSYASFANAFLRRKLNLLLRANKTAKGGQNSSGPLKSRHEISLLRL